MRLAMDDEYRLEDILAPFHAVPRDSDSPGSWRLTEKIQNSYIRALADSFWNDQQFLDDYLRAAAGKLWHHAYVGGLSEHSANVGELALRVAAGYDFLNKDYLIFGGLFHDAGKIRSYTADMLIDFTDEGPLGRSYLYLRPLDRLRAEQIEELPAAIAGKLAAHDPVASGGEGLRVAGCADDARGTWCSIIAMRSTPRWERCSDFGSSRKVRAGPTM